ncbi:MAG TPA: hypothetical protein VK558_15705 [Patescibacteria group bacterium]|nr:hypothetical protein [Patescibacteria group bacterium]
MNSTPSANGIQEGPGLPCPTLAVLPLTSNKTTILNTISQMQALDQSQTMINLGVIWGWRTLSPNWRGQWDGVSAELPVDYSNSNVTKVLMLLTDGTQTTGIPGAYKSWDAGFTSTSTVPSDPNSGGSTTQLNTNLAADCTAVKATGIKVFTIAFGDTSTGLDDTTKALLQNCSSGAGFYYVAPAPSDLAAITSTIGAQISQLALSQ